MVLPGRLAPAEMFPAGREDLRTVYLRLSSGLEVRAVEAGDPGAPAVLLFPGWGCSVYVFRENLAAIAGVGFRAIAVDLKGHGLSDKPVHENEYDLDSMLTHVGQIARAIGDERIVVGGLSMGAALAAHLAVAQPEMIRGLILVSPVGFKGMTAFPLVTGLPLIKGATPARATPVLARLARRSTARLLLSNIYGRLRRFTERDVDEYWAPTQFPEFVIALRNLLHRFNWNTGFPRFAAPSMLITGSRDRFTRRSGREEYSLDSPPMEWLDVKDAGHVVLDEAPEIVNLALVAFLRSLPP
jgi:2-hydroxy-6-oxonona-2,4-dienedioate hydrolase